jgi:hypothetical protein
MVLSARVQMELKEINYHHLIIYKFQTQVLSGSKDDILPILINGIKNGEQITILKLSNEDATTMSDALTRVKS